MACEFDAQPGHCWCGRGLTGRQKRFCSPAHRSETYRNHRWTQARAHARAQAAWYLCARCGEFTQTPEVNHIVPCKGKHGAWGCHHHQANLEVLCPPCHRHVTADQRAKGLL